jgi:NAD+ diphosphatase
VVLQCRMRFPTPKEAYTHCVRCGELVVNKGSAFICANCGYHFFLPPALCNGVIIENKSGQILLIRRARDPKKGLWDVPGGFVETTETFEHSVVREAREELGVEVQMRDIVGIYNNRYLYMGINEWTIGVIVTAQILSGELKAGDDASSWEFIDKSEVLRRRIAFSAVRRGLEDFLAGKQYHRRKY